MCELFRRVRIRGLIRGSHGLFEKRPAAGGVSWTGVAAASFTPPPFRVDQGSQILKTVSRNDAGGGQFPQPVLNFAR